MSFYEDNIFPIFLDYATKPFRRDRAEIVGKARGHILELGIGTGANLPYYSNQAEKVVGIEPCAAMLDTARKEASALENQDTEFVFMEESAEKLPFDDNSFDTVIACLVFCTIPNSDWSVRLCAVRARPAQSDVRSTACRMTSGGLGSGGQTSSTI